MGKDDFDGAVKILKDMPAKEKEAIPLSDKSKIYALFKCAKVGSCKDKGGSRPGIFDMKARGKYDAWNALGDMDVDEAKRQYCLLADQYVPGWRAPPDASATQKLMAAKTRFTRSKRFVTVVRDVFVDVDNDKSGHLDVDEVYIAVLKLYIKIQGFCKGAEPPTRQQVDEMFYQFTDGGEAMEFEQFKAFCEFLGAQIGGRVAVQMLLVNVIAPLLALVTLFLWNKVMTRFAPDTLDWFESLVPMPVVVTVGVGTFVSFFVPPLMGFIDKHILKCADDATPNSPSPTGLVGGVSSAGKKGVAAVGGAVGGAVSGVTGVAKGAAGKVGGVAGAGARKVGMKREQQPEAEDNGGCCGARKSKDA